MSTVTQKIEDEESLDAESCAPSQLNDNELCLQVVGGRNKKGHIYGLCSHCQSVSSSPSINSRVISNTYQHLKIAELSKDTKELKKQLRQLNHKFDKLVSVLEKYGFDLQGINDTSEDEDNQS